MVPASILLVILKVSKIREGFSVLFAAEGGYVNARHAFFPEKRFFAALLQ